MAINTEKFLQYFPVFRNVNLSPYKKFKAYEKGKITMPLLDDRTVFWNVESPITIDGIGLPAATALLDISRQRKIILTEVQGRDGTVKETSNLGDYKINIKGIATAHEISQQGLGTLWLDTLRSLEERSSKSLEVKNEILNTFNIQYIVISEVKYKFFAFEIDCVSDDNIELELWAK